MTYRDWVRISPLIQAPCSPLISGTMFRVLPSPPSQLSQEVDLNRPRLSDGETDTQEGSHLPWDPPARR